MSKIELEQFIPKAPLSFHQEEMKRIVEQPTNSKQEWEIRFSAITISGRSGTGKTVVAQILADKYGIRPHRVIKTGQLFRQIIREQTGEDIIDYSERDIAIDAQLDTMQTNALHNASQQNPIMLEGRLAGVIESERKEEVYRSYEQAKQTGVPLEYRFPVVRLLFTAPADVCYKRIQNRYPEKTLRAVKEMTRSRDEKDLEQWRKLHLQLEGINPFDPKNHDKEEKPMYDLVVPTGRKTAKGVADYIHDWLVENEYVVPRKEDAKKKESLTVAYALNLLIFSYLIAQQKMRVQDQIFQYFHHLRPHWKIDDNFKQALFQATMREIAHHIHPVQSDQPLEHQVIDHPPVPQEKMEEDVRERIQEMQHAFNNKYPTWGKLRLMADIIGLIVEKEFGFLDRKKGRMRINTDPKSPRGDRWLSVICYYALLGNSTELHIFDEFFKDMKTFIKTPYLFHLVEWETDAYTDFIVKTYNKHHPDTPVRGFWADPDAI